MKRWFQIVAVLVVGLMVTQPALGAYAECGASGVQHVCCMHPAMPAHSDMPGIAAGQQSATIDADCCPIRRFCGAGQEPRQQSATTAAKFEDLSAAVTGAAVPIPEHSVIALTLTGDTASAPPARYVLFRAIRI